MQISLSAIYNSGYQNILVYCISLASVILGIYIIISKNPVISVLFLIGLFVTISIYLIYIGLYFLGLSYLLVYVGAISILFLFILMLINIRVSELLTDSKNSVPLAVITTLCFNYSVNNTPLDNAFMYNKMLYYHIISICNSYFNRNLPLPIDNNDVVYIIINYLSLLDVSNVDSKCWDSISIVISHINSIGNILYTNLFILFILISLILLLAMIGAITITISKPNTNA